MPAFSIICISGLSVLSVIAGFCSLWMPLGGPVIHIMLLVPVLGLWFLNKSVKAIFKKQLQSIFLRQNPAVVFFLAGSLLTVLIMNAWTINHPDTIAYHLQTKQWIEDYKAVPGIVHLDTHYGYQGMWYVLCALFSFKFLLPPSTTFINCAVIAWYVLFIAKKINEVLAETSPQKIFTGILFALLFIVSTLDYGQLRLTVTSLSPDFIAGIYVWLIFYLVLNQDEAIDNATKLMLIAFLGITAITIKLSAIAAGIFVLWALYRSFTQITKKAAVFLLLLSAITIIPFTARNVIASGYVVFPSVFPNLADTDWKFSKESTVLEKEYISAYARIRGVSGKENIAAVNAMKPAVWIPLWWHNRSLTEKFYLSSLLFFLLAGIAGAGKIKKQLQQQEAFVIACAASIAGILFWFISAPDPRFAYGFLIPVQGIIVYYLLAKSVALFRYLRRIMVYGLAVFSIATVLYGAHRCIYYFKPINIYKPSGALAIKYRQAECGGIKINIPINNAGCGDLAIPCSERCNGYILRGKTIQEGFKANPAAQ